jgi:transcriptional regulator with XRE-family HTH domain
MAFGDRVRGARQRIRAASGARLTQGDLAVAVGVERNTVSRWENSGVCPKDPQVVRRLAAVLQVSMEWLFGDEDVEGGESRAGGAGAAALGGERVGRISPTASEIVAHRMPPPAYERVHAYIERAERAGATVGQAEEVARMLVDAASTRLRTQPARERPIDAVLADIDVAWRYVATILRAEGLAVEGAPAVVGGGRWTVGSGEPSAAGEQQPAAVNRAAD